MIFSHKSFFSQCWRTVCPHWLFQQKWVGSVQDRIRHPPCHIQGCYQPHNSLVLCRHPCSTSRWFPSEWSHLHPLASLKYKYPTYPYPYKMQDICSVKHGIYPYIYISLKNVRYRLCRTWYITHIIISFINGDLQYHVYYILCFWVV